MQVGPLSAKVKRFKFLKAAGGHAGNFMPVTPGWSVDYTVPNEATLVK